MDVVFFNPRAKIFFNLLDRRMYARAVRGLELLGKRGNSLGMPDSKAIGKGLFELRIVGITNVRFIYAFHNSAVWILHAFEKKTDRILKSELAYARKQQRLLASI